jgi:glutaredoxin
MRLASIILLLFVLVPTFAAAELTIEFYWGDGCPHCGEEKPFLQGLVDKYPGVTIESYETWHDKENAARLENRSKELGISQGGVPTTVINDIYWVGYSKKIGTQIEEYVRYALSEQQAKPCIYVFYQPDCSQCQRVVPYIDNLSRVFGYSVKKYDMTETESQLLFGVFKDTYGISETGFPVVFIGDRYLVGETIVMGNFEKEVENCISTGCVCPVERIDALTPHPPTKGDFTPSSDAIVKLPLVGEIDLGEMPIILVTALIGFLDGVNPCSLWVITFLLGVVIHSGSRKKVIIVGATFLLVGAIAYSLFMIGLLSVFSYISYLTWIRVGVAIVALAFAGINIKDYFWYRKGVSLTLSDKSKSRIFRKVRGIMQIGDSIPALIIGTAALSLGVTLAELPCTVGLPVIWTNMVVASGVSSLMYDFLLLLYMILFFLDEMIVFGTIAVTLRVSRFEEKHGRMLKLFGGMIMLALGGCMLFFPAVMDSLLGSVAVFGAAVGVSFVILKLTKAHRK